MTTIITKYIGPTNTRFARIIADAGLKRRISISTEKLSTFSPHRDAAIALCKKMNWHGTLAEGGLDNGGSAFVFIEDHATFTV